MDQIGEWLVTHDHVSATRNRSERKFIKDTLAEVRQYYDTCVQKVRRWSMAAGPRLFGKPLEEADEALIESRIEGEARTAAATILRHLKAFAGENNRIGLPFDLSSKLLGRLCGDKRMVVSTRTGRRAGDGPTWLRWKSFSGLGSSRCTRTTRWAITQDVSRAGMSSALACCQPEVANGNRELARKPTTSGDLVVELAAEGGTTTDLSGAEHGGRRARRRRDGGQGGVLWWKRIYPGKLLVPADFLEGRERKLLGRRLGPYRHRYVSRVGGCASSDQRCRQQFLWAEWLEWFVGSTTRAAMGLSSQRSRCFCAPDPRSPTRLGFRSLRAGELVEFLCIEGAKGFSARTRLPRSVFFARMVGSANSNNAEPDSLDPAVPGLGADVDKEPTGVQLPKRG